jgi:hypothetical protein
MIRGMRRKALTEYQPASTAFACDGLRFILNNINPWTIEVTSLSSPPAVTGLANAKEVGSVSVYVGTFNRLALKSLTRTHSDTRWIAESIENQEEIISAAINHYIKAADLNASILVFPEFCYLPHLEEKIEASLRSKGYVKRIPLACLGSHHVLAPCGYINKAIVVGPSFREIPELCQSKRNPVVLRVGSARVNEAIFRSREIQVVVSPIGTVATFICHDLSQQLYVDELPLNQLPIDFIIVPSLSKSTEPHSDRARRYGLHHPTTVIVANQSALSVDGQDMPWPEHDQSFVYQATSSSRGLLKPRLAGRVVGGLFQFFELSSLHGIALTAEAAEFEKASADGAVS